MAFIRQCRTDEEVGALDMAGYMLVHFRQADGEAYALLTQSGASAEWDDEDAPADEEPLVG